MPLASPAAERVLESGRDLLLRLPDANAGEQVGQRRLSEMSRGAEQVHFAWIFHGAERFDQVGGRHGFDALELGKALGLANAEMLPLEPDPHEWPRLDELPQTLPEVAGLHEHQGRASGLYRGLLGVAEVGDQDRTLVGKEQKPRGAGKRGQVTKVGRMQEEEPVEAIGGKPAPERRLPLRAAITAHRAASRGPGAPCDTPRAPGRTPAPGAPPAAPGGDHRSPRRLQRTWSALRYPSGPWPVITSTARSAKRSRRRISSRAATSVRCTSTKGTFTASSASRMARLV